MLHGSVPRSIARSLAGGPVEPNYTPDGLTEQTIDDLFDELGCRVAVPDVPTRPAWLLACVAETSWERQWTRQEPTAAQLLVDAATSVAGEVA
jgi:hypothetical protein